MEQLHKLTKLLRRTSRGQLLVEILLAIAITAIMLPALLTGLLSSKQGKAQQAQRVQAVALMKEAEEVVRNVRDQGWNVFSVNGTYHPLITGDSWTLASGNETVNGLQRSITITDVYRNSSGTIVTSGGTLDISTKRVQIQVTWGLPYASSVNSTIYVSRYQKNAASTQTSVTDFSTGVFSTTETANTLGGEITLSTNTKGKWCSPAFSSATISLPDGPPVAVVATSSATSITTPNQAFVITSPTTTNSIKFAHVSISADTEPPVPSLRGKFTLDATKYSAAGLVPVNPGIDNTYKTNAVKYYRSTSGKMYALVATTKPDREVIAVLVDDNDDSNNNTNNGEYQDYVNGIYKYWTYFNTVNYNTAAAGNIDTGFLNPSNNASEAGGDNNGYNSNPTRVYSDNNSFATDTSSGSGSGTSCTGNDKDKHRFYDYGITVPSDGTINGIELRLDAKVDNTTGAPQLCAQLSWDGGTTWTSAKSTSTLTTNEASYTLGGSSDSWGRTWSTNELSNTNFRVRIIDVASNTSRTFSLDWAAIKVHYSGGTLNDQAPFGYGSTSLAVIGNRGYTTSGGYLYAFDLSNIDSKTQSNGLDMIGCRIQLDGYDCNPGSGTDRKYNAGQTGTTWSDTDPSTHTDCSDGGNVEIYASNDIFPVQVASNSYVYVAVGAGTMPEFNIVNTTSVPDSNSSPSISNASCGRSSGGNASWKLSGSYDFNSNNGTEEAANSVYGNSSGTRAYISSNGSSDSKQFYILDTSSKTSPSFLSGTPSSGALSGFYYGVSPDDQLYPRRSLTVLGGQRAVLVGKDGVSDANNAKEYQVLNISNETSPLYCGGLQFDQGFNDLTSVTELDNDTFVYMIGNTGTNDMKIIQGGPDGTYLSSGTYESPPKDLGTIVALNRLSVTATVSASTTLQFQVAATLPISGSCTGASYVFVGPDGTASTYFPATGGPIPLTGISGFQNPAQCVKYRANLSTTDNNVTPSILDASFNYSP